MIFSVEIIRKISSNYFQRYQNHGLKIVLSLPGFLQNVIEKDETLYKCWCYTYLPAEDFARRNELKKEIQGSRDIHERLCEGLARGENIELSHRLEELRNDCVLVESADFLFPIQSILLKNTPLTIKDIREIIGKVEVREYTEGEKNILEKKSYYNLPRCIQTERAIALNGKIKIEFESEFLPCPYLPTPDLNKIKLRLEALPIKELLQRFKNTRLENAGIDPVWSINPDLSIEYSMILSYQGERVELPLNLLHRKRYYNLIRAVLGKNKIERKWDKYVSPTLIPDEDSGFGIYKKLRREPLISDALMAVLNLALEYNEEEHGFFPGYLKNRISSYIRDIRKSHSTATLFKERSDLRARRGRNELGKTKEPLHILKSDLEYSGGSLTVPAFIGEDEDIELIDLLEAKDAEGGNKIILSQMSGWEAEREAEDLLIDKLDFEELTKELINSLPDPLDKAIFKRYYLEEEPIIQIGKGVGISHQAVSKRLKKIEEHLKKKIQK